MSRSNALIHAAAMSVAVAVGCGQEPAPKPAPKPAETPKAADPAHGHTHGDHGAGPHGGVVADWGGGKYHVEFTVDHDKQEATVYLLGGDEKTPAPLKATDGKLLLTITQPSFQVDLKADPLNGELEGAASRYAGKHEKLGVVQEFAGTISGEIDGTPYAADFKEEPHGDHEHK